MLDHTIIQVFVRSTLSVAFIIACTTQAFSASLTREEVSWKNGDVELFGTLYLPISKGPHPAFVFLHGSGPEGQSEMLYRLYAAKFARNDIAVLIYDKRGVGKSTGDWIDGLYEDYARDAAAGIELLKGRKDIDPQNIGIIGQSEGGWTGPLTATMAKDVFCVVMISGPAVSPYLQGLYDMSVELRALGVTEEEIEEAVELERHRMQVLRTGTGEEALVLAIDAAKKKSWYAKVGSPGVPDPSNRRTNRYRLLMDHDPIPILKSLDMPVLALYGDSDPLVNGPRSANIMEQVKQDYDKDFTIRVIPGARHDLTIGRSGWPDEHWDRILSWIGSKLR